MSKELDHDELAEAAVFLAHASLEHELPPDLERRLFVEGRAIAADARIGVQRTTNRAGALALDMAPPAPGAPAQRSWREWAAWSVAAACFAIAVFEWRATTLEHERHAAADGVSIIAATTTIALVDPRGAGVADVTWSDDAHSGTLVVRDLPPLTASARYQVWVRSQTEAPTPLGFFSCESGCRDLRVPLAAPTPVGHGGEIEITRSGEEPLSGAERFIARGSFPAVEKR
ncbi:hypothetical protein BH09MYX1_BH09MYX1_35110 [soil metagenome]